MNRTFHPAGLDLLIIPFVEFPVVLPPVLLLPVLFPPVLLPVLLPQCCYRQYCCHRYCCHRCCCQYYCLQVLPPVLFPPVLLPVLLPPVLLPPVLLLPDVQLDQKATKSGVWPTESRIVSFTLPLFETIIERLTSSPGAISTKPFLHLMHQQRVSTVALLRVVRR